jgi:hypothetical protein
MNTKPQKPQPPDPRQAHLPDTALLDEHSMQSALHHFFEALEPLIAAYNLTHPETRITEIDLRSAALHKLHEFALEYSTCNICKRVHHPNRPCLLLPKPRGN